MFKVFRPLAQTMRMRPQFSCQAYFSTIRKYTKEHEWVNFNETTKIGEIGITNHAQNELGDIVHLDTNEVGTPVHLGQTIGSIESVKSTSDIYSPVTGEIAEVNKEVVADCARINKDAEKSWIYRIKITNPTELNLLMSKDEYEKFLKQ